MKILFLTHYYPPEGNAPASRVSALAERWSAAGHDVTVITGVPNVPNGIIYDGYENRWVQREERNGVHVIRVWTYIAANKGFFRRVMNYISYMYTAFWRGLRLGFKPDVVIATSPQFFCAWAGYRLHCWRRVPFVMEVRDIWPEELEEVSIPKAVIKVLSWMARKMYRASAKIVTVGEGYRQRLGELGVPKEKIEVVMNGVDSTLFYPRPVNHELLAQYGLDGKFICSFVGTIGMAHGLEIIIRAAELLKERDPEGNIVLLLVGDGAERKNLEAEAREKHLDNIVFTGRVDKKMIPDWLCSSDISLVHLRKTKLYTTVMPSKIFESAGCGRPMIIGVDGFAWQLVDEAGAGVHIEPENAEELTEVLLNLRAHPEECRKMGENALTRLAAHHNRDTQAAAYIEILENIVNANHANRKK